MSDVTLAPVTTQDHVRGSASAPLTLIEYGDFQCPYCAEAHAIVKRLEAHFGERLRFVFRQFPLRSIHPHAEAAAEAAEAAGAQGRFWEMYDALYTHARALRDTDLRTYAQQIGVPDMERFDRELAERRYAARIEDAIDSGESSGVDGTPTFFINGAPFEDDDPTFESLAAALEEAAR